MTLAGDRLAQLAAWLDKSSANGRSPFGHEMPVGRYAEILPWDFDEQPTADFAEHALPLFVPFDQATGVDLPATASLSNPTGQLRAGLRLEHILFRLGDAKLALPWRGKADDDHLPLCAVVGLTDPKMSLWEAVDAAGGADVDLDAYPLLAVPLWAMSVKEQAEISTMLPFVP